MTQEDKELLFKDLSARLPYGVKIHINSPIEEQNSMELFDVNLDSEHIGVGNGKWAFRAIPIIDDEDEAKVVKPYLRPMSSMTEEEKREYQAFFNYDGVEYPEEYIDWLNAHHFDFHNLIGRGLAIDCTGLNIY
jgi:DNA-directed RNA polymerase delta subunit